MDILASIKNLNLAFGEKILFKNANFQIAKGDKIGLIGLNGVGKSSLFKILNGDITSDNAAEFIFDKASDKKGEEFEYSVFLVGQQFMLPEKSTSARNYLFFFYPKLAELHEALKDPEVYQKRPEITDEMDHLKYWDKINAYESYLKAFGIENLDEDVNLLSGGQQKKILLALGLSADNNLILWDEPTNHLDIETIEFFEGELMASQKTFVIISHDRHLLSKVCNKILHISRGEIREFRGSYADYLEFLNIQEEERVKKLQKLKNTLSRETDWMRQGIKARGTRSKKRVENFLDLSKKVQDIKNQAKKSMELTINNSQRKTKQLVSFKDVSFGYDDKTLLTGLDFTLFKGDKIGVVGPNGVGKSTLMNLISGTLQPKTGNIKRAEDIKICYFDQKRDSLDLTKTPHQYLGDGEDFIHFRDGRSLHVASYFQNFLFSTDQLHRPLSSFSGGELNRLHLALNLKNEADVWIFDEPTNDLDIESIEILEEKLAKFDGTVILISHDRSFLENVTNKVWLMEEGSIEFFESGYSQVAAYIDACHMERDLSQQERTFAGESNSSAPDSKASAIVEKLSNKEKSRLKKIPSLIEEKELMLEKIEASFLGMDYSSMDQADTQKLADLNEQKHQVEEDLLLLYEELESLELRQGG